MANAVDWDALAADVLANFEATGQWFVTGAPPPPPNVDWDALAAHVATATMPDSAGILGKAAFDICSVAAFVKCGLCRASPRGDLCRDR